MDNEKNHLYLPVDELDDTGTFNVEEKRLADLITCSSRCCHNCNKIRLKAVLRRTSEFKPNLLNLDFVVHVVANVHSNKAKLDRENVRVTARIINNFLRNEQDFSKRKRLVVSANVLPIARMLLRFIVGIDDDKSLVKDVMDILRMTFRATCSYHPDEGLVQDLIECFSFDPWNVFFIAWFVVESISSSEEYLKFWEGFTTGVHEACRSKWRSDPEFALVYAKIITNYRKPIGKKPRKDHNGQSYNYGRLSDRYSKGLVEVLRKVDIVPSRRMLSYLMQPVMFVPEEVMHLYSEKISWVLTNHPFKLNHDACLDDKIASWPQKKLQLKKSCCKHLLFLDDVIEIMWQQRYKFQRFDLDVIDNLIRLVNYDHLNDNATNLIHKMFVDYCVHSADKNNQSELLNTRIPQTIWDVINNLHEVCLVCRRIFICMNESLNLMKPNTFSIMMELNDKRSTQLAVSIPYVVRDNLTLIQIMYLDGFALLFSQLEQGEHVESLFMLAQAFRPEIIGFRKTVSCTKQPIQSQHCTKGTQVFVLDDGTKIPTEQSLLVKNSEYFSHLLDGRFTEASLEEIPLPDVTAFQFNFIENHITAEPATYKINFDMDDQAHMDLIILCDKLVLQNLRDSIVDSFRWYHMKAESCPEVYRASVSYGIRSWRKACVNFALLGDVSTAPNMDCLQKMFEECDKKCLVEDIREWIKDEYESVRALLLFDNWTYLDESELEKITEDSLQFKFERELGRCSTASFLNKSKLTIAKGPPL